MQSLRRGRSLVLPGSFDENLNGVASSCRREAAVALLNDFRRVTRSSPCPICDHPDWCLVSRDHPPSCAVCQRVESRHRWRDAGWLHRLRPDDSWRPRRHIRTIAIRPSDNAPDLGALATRYVSDVPPVLLDAFAERLGVTTGSLRRLRIGWAGRAWSFPMIDPRCGDRVCGIRLRPPDGTKYAVKGGKEGLFVPTGLKGDGPLLIAEGATDTAALLDLGFDAIGRPSCSGGVRHVLHFVKVRAPARVVIVADQDAPGQVGAAALARTLAAHHRDVRVITPPAKDARAWLRLGATRADLAALIESVAPTTLAVTCRRVET